MWFFFIYFYFGSFVCNYVLVCECDFCTRREHISRENPLNKILFIWCFPLINLFVLNDLVERESVYPFACASGICSFFFVCLLVAALFLSALPSLSLLLNYKLLKSSSTTTTATTEHRQCQWQWQIITFWCLLDTKR